VSAEHPDTTPTSESTEHTSLENPAPTPEWQLWPPSPKMQIAMIAAAFGLFNFLLLAIFAIVMAKQF